MSQVAHTKAPAVVSWLKRDQVDQNTGGQRSQGDDKGKTHPAARNVSI